MNKHDNINCINSKPCQGCEYPENDELKQEELISKLKLSPKKLLILNDILELEREITLQEVVDNNEDHPNNCTCPDCSSIS